MGDEGESTATSSRARCSSNPVHEKLWARRKVEIHYVVNQRDVDTSGRHVRHDEKVHCPLPKRVDVDCSRRLLHGAVNSAGLQPSLLEDSDDQLDVMLGGDEDDRGLVWRDGFLAKEEQSTELFCRRHREKPHVQIIRYLALRVKANHLRVFEPSTRKLRNHGGKRRGKQERLLALVKGLEDTLYLVTEPELEHPIRFVNHHHPHVLKVEQVYFIHVVYQAARRRDNQVRVVCKLRELLLHRVSSDKQRRAKVCVFPKILCKLERLHCELSRG
mmetsp:Transcript_6353/g.11612  ORF Transcript_6353/g.11612 Transcript_6353/m.11612 type:complete len:273 (-) Transcript_6353:283-1101(-)